MFPAYDYAHTRTYYAGTHNNLVYVRISIRVPRLTKDRMTFPRFRRFISRTPFFHATAIHCHYGIDIDRRCLVFRSGMSVTAWAEPFCTFAYMIVHSRSRSMSLSSSTYIGILVATSKTNEVKAPRQEKPMQVVAKLLCCQAYKTMEKRFVGLYFEPCMGHRQQRPSHCTRDQYTTKKFLMDRCAVFCEWAGCGPKIASWTSSEIQFRWPHLEHGLSLEYR